MTNRKEGGPSIEVIIESKGNYRGQIFGALIHDNIEEAVKIYKKCDLRDIKIDLKDILRSVLMDKIYNTGRHQKISDDYNLQIGMPLPPDEEETSQFDPNQVDTQIISDFAAKLGITFDIKKELQPMVEKYLSWDLAYLRKINGETTYDNIKKFAKAKDIDLKLNTPEVKKALQKNLEDNCFGYLFNDLKHNFANTAGYDQQQYVNYVKERIDLVLDFAKQQGIQLDVEKAAKEVLRKIFSIEDNPKAKSTEKILIEVAKEYGVDLTNFRNYFDKE